jgi:hypothetical protein
MKTYTINAETHPVLFNLLTLTEVCDCDIVLDDEDSSIAVHLGDLIDGARIELLGE